MKSHSKWLAKLFASLCSSLLFSAVVCSASKESPKIQPFQFPKHIQIGDKTSVQCLIMRGHSPVSYKWYKNGHSLKETKGISVESNEKFSTLLLDPVEEASVGNYTCSVNSPYGSDNYSAFLSVKGK
ncbi:neurotrimin-like [Stegodyphus dumicola]|uniref:neurotrimin-like n=1 Tax=Stegodyphus dumicola TaxID=202533 RepID=UPI0015B1FA16|nr:neurotrimin-like [Stegodyphus dumicola]